MTFLLSVYYFNESAFKILEREKEKYGDMNPRNFLFGETSPLTTRLLLQEIEIKKGSRVYDLGCGRGTFVFTANMLYGVHSVGVEIFESYTEKCNRIRQKMKIAGVHFINKNFMDIDISDGDIIYVTATVYEEDFLNKLDEKLKTVKPDTIVISVHHPLKDDEAFVLINQGYYPFSWGSDYVYYYRRK